MASKPGTAQKTPINVEPAKTTEAAKPVVDTVVEATKPVVEVAKAAPAKEAVKPVVEKAKAIAPAAPTKAAPKAKAAPARVAKKASDEARTVVAKTAAKAAKAAAPVKKAIETAAKTVKQPVRKETTLMTNFEDTVTKTQAAFGELNERAKAQFEKNAKLVEEFNGLAKGNVEALVESGKITAKGFETLAQDSADFTRKSFEKATATFKQASAVKSPADFFKLQSDFVREQFDALVAQTSKNTEAVMKLAGDAAQPLSSRYALAMDKAKAAA